MATLQETLGGGSKMTLADVLNAPEQQPVSRPSLTQTTVGSVPVVKQLNQLGAGIGTGVGKAVLNTAKGILSATKNISVFPSLNDKAIKAIDTIRDNIFQKPFENELDTGFGKVGNFVGQTAVATGLGAPISGVSNLATNAIKGTGFLPGLARTAAGASIEGLGGFGSQFLTSGGDINQAKNAGIFAGATKGLLSGTGEILNSLGAPQGIAEKVFRTTPKEQKQIFRGENPINIAKEVVDRGIKGNVNSVAQQLIDGQSVTESSISREFAKAGNPTITLNDPKRYIKYILDKARTLERAGATQEAKGLKYSVNAIDPITGEITANNALSLRRFLDGLRYEKTFLQPTEQLSAQQAGLSEMADHIRSQINKIGATGKYMKDYQFFIKALDKAASYASRQKNNDALGFISSYLLGEGISSANPYLIAAGIGRRSLTTMGGATRTAQAIKNLGKSSATGVGIRTGLGGLINPNNQ